jgi:cytochrome b6-f complex iron-sulfur subunit
MMDSSPQLKPRRSFLAHLLAVWSGLIAMPIFYGVSRFIYPPPRRSTPVESLTVFPANELPPNMARIVRLNRKPVIILHSPPGQFRALSASCTHLGCTVEYKSADNMFHCNCHGSIFDANGKVVKGPAVLPLEPIRVFIKNTDVTLSIEKD